MMLEYEYKTNSHYGLNKSFIKRANKNNAARKLERERQERIAEMKKRFKEILVRDVATQPVEAVDKETIEYLRITYSKIEKRICKIFKLNPIELRSNRNLARLVFARQAIMYWSARLTLHSYPKIGQLMGGKDHTTIIHGVKVYRVKREKMGRHLRRAR